MAVIDGIQNKIHPGDPLDKDIYDLPPEEAAAVPKTPGSLGCGPGCTRSGSRVPAAGRCVHGRRDFDLDRLQAEERSRRTPVASASVRILPLLRYLISILIELRPSLSAWAVAIVSTRGGLPKRQPPISLIRLIRGDIAPRDGDRLLVRQGASKYN